MGVRIYKTENNKKTIRKGLSQNMKIFWGSTLFFWVFNCFYQKKRHILTKDMIIKAVNGILGMTKKPHHYYSFEVKLFLYHAKGNRIDRFVSCYVIYLCYDPSSSIGIHRKHSFYHEVRIAGIHDPL